MDRRRRYQERNRKLGRCVQCGRKAHVFRKGKHKGRTSARCAACLVANRETLRKLNGWKRRYKKSGSYAIR